MPANPALHLPAVITNQCCQQHEQMQKISFTLLMPVSALISSLALPVCTVGDRTNAGKGEGNDALCR